MTHAIDRELAGRVRQQADAERRLLDRERRAERALDEAETRLRRAEARLASAQRLVAQERAAVQAAADRLRRRQAERAAGPDAATGNGKREVDAGAPPAPVSADAAAAPTTDKPPSSPIEALPVASVESAADAKPFPADQPPAVDRSALEPGSPDPSGAPKTGADAAAEPPSPQPRDRRRGHEGSDRATEDASRSTPTRAARAEARTRPAARPGPRRLWLSVAVVSVLLTRVRPGAPLAVAPLAARVGASVAALARGRRLGARRGR